MTRKANGESSIYKDDQGRWHGWVSLGLREHGKADRWHVSGKARGEVVAKVRELEQKRDAGLAPVAGKSMTFGEWMDHWLTIAKRTVRVQTCVGYECYVRLHIKPALGHHRLDRLQPEHLEAFYTHLADAKGLSPAMQLQQHRVISRALKIAMQRGRGTPQRRPLVGRAGHGSTPWRSPRGRWQDLDLEAGTWRVVQCLQRQAYRHSCGTTPCGQKPLRCPQRTGGLVFVEPKSEKGKRTIAIPRELTAQKAHRQRQEQERAAAGSLWQDHGLVFAQVTGKMIDPSRVWEEWKRILREAEVRDGRLHDARHTAATLLLEQGVDARVVMEILGHSQITLTQNTYQHVMPKVIADATQRVATVLFGPLLPQLLHRQRRKNPSLTYSRRSSGGIRAGSPIWTRTRNPSINR